MKQQLEAVGLGPPAKFSSEADRRLQLCACLTGALPERCNRQDLLPAASLCACSCPQPSLLMSLSLLLQNWGSQEEDAA